MIATPAVLAVPGETWPGVVWPLLFLALLVTVPGAVVGLASGLRNESVWASAPAVSLGVLAVADIATARLGLAWGVLGITLTTLALAVIALGVRLLGRATLPRAWAWARPDLPSTSLADLAWFVLGLILAATGALVAMARGLGTPDAVNQTYDAPFHVNAIEIVATRHLATPDVVASASSPDGPASFYPPLFHAIGGLAVDVTGVDAITAANLVAVIIAAVIWPASVALLVRSLLGRSRLAHLVAMAGAVLVSLFPMLLLTFGVLWPNALSIAVLPAVLALGAHVLRVAPHESMPPTTAAGLALLTLPGLYYAHPGAAFVLLFLAPVLVAASWVRFARFAWGRGTRWRVSAIALPFVLAAGALVFALLLSRIESLARVRAFQWPSRATPPHAVGEVVTLGTSLSPELMIYGALVIIGAVVALRTRLWWVSAAHVVLATLAVLAIAYDTPLSQRLTGFWYNDPWRILGPVPITALPLAALGALAWRDAWAPAVTKALTMVPALATRVKDAALAGMWAASVLVLVLIAVLVPGRTGLDRIGASLSGSYAAAGDKLVTPAEEQLYRDLASQLAPGQTVTGNPWSGVVYAGVLSGHPTLWTHLAIVPDPERTLLAQRFKDFTTDPAVCAAVKELKVGVVVEDTDMLWEERDTRWRNYPGFTDLAATPGLTKIGSADTATAYKVGDCRS